MVFADHDFHHNFCNAVGGDNYGMQKDIFISEITKIIADNKDAVLNAARESGINVPQQADHKKTVSILLENLKNKNFQKKIAKIILSENKLSENSVLEFKQQQEKNTAIISNGTPQELVSQKKPAMEALLNVMDDLSEFGSTKEEQAKTKADISNKILGGIAAEEPKKSKAGTYLLVASLIGLGIYAYIKFKK